jgi:hypothetical protein
MGNIKNSELLRPLTIILITNALNSLLQTKALLNCFRRLNLFNNRLYNSTQLDTKSDYLL